MKNGKYSTNNTDFSKYKVTKFVPHLFYSPHYDAIGCGPATVSLLTGIPPTRSMLKVNPKNTRDDDMLEVLSDNDIQNFPITKCEMTSNRHVVANKITSQHVVLISQLYLRNEASWGVLYDDILYHNFRPCAWTNLDLLNRPILSAYVLWNPNWDTHEFTHLF